MPRIMMIPDKTGFIIKPATGNDLAVFFNCHTSVHTASPCTCPHVRWQNFM